MFFKDAGKMVTITTRLRADMVVTFPAQRSANGPRQVNLNRDLPQLVDLLHLAFGEALEIDGQRVFTGMPGRPPALLWRINPTAARLAPGFVWEENGRIVGNVTLLPSFAPGRYLVANVAVHPDYRRRGIARVLMQHVLAYIAGRGGQVVLLQVVKENQAAIDLYKALDFISLGSMTHWQSSVLHLRELVPFLTDAQYAPVIRPLGGWQWREAYALDCAALHLDLNWPEPPAPDAYKLGLWQRFNDFINGRQREFWAVVNDTGELQGVAAIESDWGRPHRVSVRVPEARRAELERPLLAKVLRRLRYLARRNVRIEHPDDDDVMNQLLRDANFTPRRTLTHMKLELGR
jgi:ribosomal protein S18 acetylase RimI-like enzyme